MAQIRGFPLGGFNQGSSASLSQFGSTADPRMETAQIPHPPQTSWISLLLPDYCGQKAHSTPERKEGARRVEKKTEEICRSGSSEGPSSPLGRRTWMQCLFLYQKPRTGPR